MVNVGAQAITPGTSAVTITQGYHNGSGRVAGDAELKAENIRVDVNIFSIVGTLAAGVTCTGTLSSGKRWCKNKTSGAFDGTVTNMSTGLIWLMDATDQYSAWVVANVAAGVLPIGVSGLFDGSVEGDWRLPTKSEFETLIIGTEKITYTNKYLFTNVTNQRHFWSSTTHYEAGFPRAYYLDVITNLVVQVGDKTGDKYVWPVRNKQ